MIRFFILLLIPTSLFGQDIITDSIKKHGLYSNFFEFRTNSPGVEGDIEFIQNNRGRVTDFLINGDTIRNKEIIRNYWGFCKDSLIYINVFADWIKLSQNRTPRNAYYPLNLGFYSYCSVETSVVNNAAAAGAMVGGLIGGLIVGGIAAAIEKNNPGDILILTVNHQNGVLEIADKMTTRFLIMDEQVIYKEFDSIPDREINNDLITHALKQFNQQKQVQNQVNFKVEEFWPTVTIVRKPRNQTQRKIEIFVNEEIVGSIGNGDFFKDKVPYKKNINIVLKTGESVISKKIEFNIGPKEKLYFIISNSLKSPSELEVQVSDATRTKYIIDEL